MHELIGLMWCTGALKLIIFLGQRDRLYRIPLLLISYTVDSSFSTLFLYCWLLSMVLSLFTFVLFELSIIDLFNPCCHFWCGKILWNSLFSKTFRKWLLKYIHKLFWYFSLYSLVTGLFPLLQYQRRNRIYKEEQRQLRAASQKKKEGVDGGGGHHWPLFLTNHGFINRKTWK